MTHISGEAQWRRGRPSRVHRDPVRVRRLHVVVGGVRVGAGDDDHAEPPAAGDELAEHVAVAQPRAAVVERNLRRVVGHAAAGAQAGRVGVGAPEVVEPEADVELRRVVLDQGELRPAHRAGDPGRRGRRPVPWCRAVQGPRGPVQAAQAHRGSGEGRRLEELAARGWGERRAGGRGLHGPDSDSEGRPRARVGRVPLRPSPARAAFRPPAGATSRSRGPWPRGAPRAGLPPRCGPARGRRSGPSA